MATEKQIAANRANAMKSTGATSPEGRERAKLNALRHGLTGQVTVMPTEDREAFNRFCAEIVASLNPANAIERQLAQSIAQDNWRLNRARAMEDNILALGHTGNAAEMDAENPQIHAAVTAARVFSDDPVQFQLLTLYMQRTNRDIHRNMQLLRELQAERRAERAAELKEASRLQQLAEMKGVPYDASADAILRATIAGEAAPFGFVFSSKEVDACTRYRHRLEQATHAERHSWNRESYRAAGHSLAA
jgi:hypothetical protein